MVLTHEERVYRRQKMAEAVETGESVFEVARRFKVSRQCVWLACQEQGVIGKSRRRVRAPHAPDSPLRIYAAIQRAEVTDSLATVGKRLGVSKQRVFQVCQEAWRYGLKTGKWMPPAKKPEEAVAQ